MDLLGRHDVNESGHLDGQPMRFAQGSAATSRCGARLLRDGEVRAVGRPGSLVGAIEAVLFQDVTEHLRSGDVLVLYTDGVTEGRRGKHFYGDDRRHDLLAASAGSPAAAVVDSMLEDVLALQGGNPRDDVVVVAVGVP